MGLTYQQYDVRKMLKQGYGVEDIAIITCRHVDDIRADVQKLRECGMLKNLF